MSESRTFYPPAASGGGPHRHSHDDDLDDVSANDHHAQTHADAQHTDGPNSKPGHGHSHDTDLSGVSADDHHTENHADTKHTTHPDHSQLGSIGADDHHAQAHTLASHSSKAHSELSGVGANDHHNQSHPDTDHSTHPAHSATTGQGVNDHHNQDHGARHVEGGGDDFAARIITVQYLKIAGASPANTASRLVGAMAAGPPASGTWAQYDRVVDLTGIEWLCISAGTPGTWIAMGTGQQLAIAKSTASFDVQAQGITPADVTSISITVQPTSRPFKLHAYLMCASNSGTAAANATLQMIFHITDNSNNILGYGADTHVAITNVSSVRRSTVDVWTEEQAAIAVATTYKLRARTGAAVPANWSIAQLQGGYGFSPAKPYYLEAIAC